jgi:hypothetical protein
MLHLGTINRWRCRVHVKKNLYLLHRNPTLQVTFIGISSDTSPELPPRSGRQRLHGARAGTRLNLERAGDAACQRPPHAADRAPNRDELRQPPER